jgi:deoxyhypusine monooxygenase
MSTKLFNDDQIDEIGSILVDTRRPLKQRFRALFMLRNIGGNRAIDAISRCFTDQSALLKHELAYCLGQMQSVYAVSTLITILDNVDEHPMVRHEAGQ